MPLLDEPIPPSAGQYHHDYTKRWAATIDSFDGYVFVTPEHNRSAPAALKTAIDFLCREWHNKAAGFVAYGSNGGSRAVEHLRLIMGELQVADVREQVALSLFNDFVDFTTFRPANQQQTALSTMLDQLVTWSNALAPLRAHALPAHPRGIYEPTSEAAAD